MALEAFMLPAAGGRDGSRFALWHSPAGQPRGLVLYAHPFAEEMNKTRRMAALQARALATAGYGVLQVDFKGCGDSSADFVDAEWADWIADVVAGAQWLRTRSDSPLTLWGLRAGCLLAAAAAAQLPAEVCNFVFWQPTPSGATVLRQFLRQAAAAAALDGGAKGVVEGLRRDIAAGRSIEVSGYRLGAALAQGLDVARLQPPARVGRVSWFEVDSSAATAELSPAGSAAAQPWRTAASTFEARVVAGPPFWQTAEIETAPALVQATLAAMQASLEPA